MAQEAENKVALQPTKSDASVLEYETAVEG